MFREPAVLPAQLVLSVQLELQEVRDLLARLVRQVLPDPAEFKAHLVQLAQQDLLVRLVLQDRRVLLV